MQILIHYNVVKEVIYVQDWCYWLYKIHMLNLLQLVYKYITITKIATVEI